jgi:hypothetical protein
MTYHSSKEKVLLFGGGSNQILADNWEWDGNEWNQVADTGPSLRHGSAMTYDSFRKRCALWRRSGVWCIKRYLGMGWK